MERDARISLVGRILFGLIFLLAGLNKIVAWDQTAGFMASRGMGMIPVFLTAALLIEVICGAYVILGYKTRSAAGILFLYLIPVTLVFHNFWTYPEPERTLQMVNFWKNLAIMGGSLGLLNWGPGRLSLDLYFKEKIEKPEPVSKEKAA